MPEIPSKGQLGQIARSVRDIEQSVDWYRDRLDLPLLFRAPGMAFFALGDLRLYLQENPAAGPESILYFLVDDIHARHLALLTLGVTFVQPPTRVHRHDDGTEEWMAFFHDLEGRPLALMQRRQVNA